MATLPDLSVQLYSVRRPMAEDFVGTLRRVAEIGLTRVEPFDLMRYADQLASTLPATGLIAPTAHQGLDGGNLEQVFEVAAGLGVEVLIHPHSPAEVWQTRAGLQALAETLGRAASVGAAHGVRVAYHNHDWELSTKIDGAAALEVFAELLDPAVLLQVDAYWAATGGADVPELLRRLGGRVVSLHLKDGPLEGDTTQLPLGSGALPAVEIVAAASGLRFPVLEFDEYAGDIFEGIALGYAYATGTLGAAR